MSQPPLHIRFGRFELDEDRHALLENGVAVSIGPKPLALLFHLARHRERVVRKDELLRAVWPGVVVTDDAIAQVVLKAREALGEVGARARIVATVRGVGFRFGVDAEPVGAAVSPVLAQVLAARGYNCPDRAGAFLDAKLTELHDPELLPGVSAAADRIARRVRPDRPGRGRPVNRADHR